MRLELTDLFGHVLLRSESAYGLTAIPKDGDMVSIESKQWEVARRHFYYQAKGDLRKVVVQCKESDL